MPASDNYGFERRQRDARQQVAKQCLQYMNRKGISRNQFANLIRLSTSQLKAIINRDSNTTLNVLVKISEVTGEPIVI